MMRNKQAGIGITDETIRLTVRRQPQETLLDNAEYSMFIPIFVDHSTAV